LFAGLAAAAATVVVAVGGLTLVPQLRAEQDSGAVTAQRDDDPTGVAGGADHPEVAPSPAPEPAGGPAAGAGLTLVNSGTDYQPGTLAQLVRTEALLRARQPLDDGGLKSMTFAPVPPVFSEGVAPPLARLTGPGDLSACLRLVQSAHGGTPTIIDFAHYEGSPALLILLRAPQSSSVVVVGPDCGRAGADEKYVVTVS
jgi:hypothetical protein